MRGSRTAALSIVSLTGAAVLLAGCSGAGEDSASLSSDESASGRTGYGGSRERGGLLGRTGGRNR